MATTNRATTWEIYGAGIGFIGWVTARTEIGAKRIARKLWPDVTDFAAGRI